MNKIRFHIFVLFLIICNLVSPAKENKKVFYDSKSWIVNMAGDPYFFINNGFESKINPIKVNVSNPCYVLDTHSGTKIAEFMTKNGYGKKFIDALTNNGTSDEILKKCALKNSQIQDVEFGTSTVIGGESETELQQFLMDQYEPILMHNYYCFTRESIHTSGDITITFTDFFLFKVKITKEEAFDIVASIGDPEKYDKLEFPIEFVTSGMPLNLEKFIEKEVPDLVLRGVLLRRHPSQISLGSKHGLKAGDLISIYSQKTDKNGNPYSQRISQARVSKVWDEISQINFEANTKGNRKNGDIAVKTPDKKLRGGIKLTWMPHNFGASIFSDLKVGFARSGVIQHLMMDFGFSLYENMSKRFVNSKLPKITYSAPFFFNFSFGYGISKTMIGFIDVMPFFLGQFEIGAMDSNQKKDTEDNDISGVFLRAPLGLRVSINLKYPTRLFVEGGWSFGLPLNKKSRGYQDLKWAMDYLSIKRDGLFVNLGLIF